MTASIRVPFSGDGLAGWRCVAGFGERALLEDTITGRALLFVGDGPCFTWSAGQTGDLYEELRGFHARHRPASVSDDDGFPGGIVGFLGYDARCATERSPDDNPAESTMPDVRFRVPPAVIEFGPHDDGGVRVTAHDEELLEDLRIALGTVLESPDAGCPPHRPAVPGLTPAEYEAAVDRARAHIAAGDVYQLNLTQRFLVRCDEDVDTVYARLRKSHPACRSALLEFDDHAILSVSPETFVTVDRGAVESWPIKGTIGRGAKGEDDEALRRALLASEKDRAELDMIVDLMRNDLSRVCLPGSVEVRDHPHIESTPTVHHLVSRIVGRLEPPHDVFSLLAAAHPGGSITGCPKIRAMELIDRLETVRRGVYTGSIGYVDWRGDAMFSIAIRTMVLHAGYARVHGGGGIVWDSRPETEYREVQDKLRGLLEALGAEIPCPKASS